MPSRQDLLRAQEEVVEEAYTLIPIIPTPISNDDSGSKRGEAGMTVQEGEPIVFVTFRFVGYRLVE